MAPPFAKPECRLIGTDGNVFAIIGAVSRTLRRAGQADRATEFSTKATQQDSYGAVLNLVNEYVEVT